MAGAAEANALLEMTPAEYNCFLDEYDETEKIKKSILRLSLYLGLIAQGTLLRPSRNRMLRGLILELYSDYFQFGVDSSDQLSYDKQEAFLSSVVSNQLAIVPGGDKGYKPMLEQIRMYTMLHAEIMIRPIGVKCVDRDGDIFVMTAEVSLVINHQTISILYPHMLYNPEFMRKAVGKVLKFVSSSTVIFSQDNQMLSYRPEQPFVQAWYNLLGDLDLTAKVMKEMFIDESCCISAEASQVARMVAYLVD